MITDNSPIIIKPWKWHGMRRLNFILHGKKIGYYEPDLDEICPFDPMTIDEIDILKKILTNENINTSHTSIFMETLKIIEIPLVPESPEQLMANC